MPVELDTQRIALLIEDGDAQESKALMDLCDGHSSDFFSKTRPLLCSSSWKFPCVRQSTRGLAGPARQFFCEKPEEPDKQQLAILNEPDTNDVMTTFRQRPMIIWGYFSAPVSN